MDGHHCDYRRQWGQDKVNAAVEETVKKMVNNPKFRAALKDKIGANVDASELKTERESYRKSLQQCIGAKNKLAAQIDALDITDKHYDRKYQDMQDRLDTLYDRIADLEEKIDDVTDKISRAYDENLTSKQLCKVLLQFDEMLDHIIQVKQKEHQEKLLQENMQQEKKVPEYN